MDTALFDYALPPELIAQKAIEPRDAARLFVTSLNDHQIAHRHVRDLSEYFHAGDLVVLNRTRVIPARLFGKKESGGAIEVLLIHPADDDAAANTNDWMCLIRGRVKPGQRLLLSDITAEVIACDDESGERRVRFPLGMSVLALADRIGHIPLPPYIHRDDTAADKERYQTVFANKPGSVAAPTASLHLTQTLLDQLKAQGVHFADVELRIGPGTFKPVDTERVEDFRIHAEYAICPPETVTAIAACRARGGRVIAIGTTVVRTLESAVQSNGELAPCAHWTRLFLYPPQRLHVVDALMTNFHLPRSSLLMLVACLAGTERLQNLYRTAIAERYRFFSYGDAMLFI